MESNKINFVATDMESNKINFVAMDMESLRDSFNFFFDGVDFFVFLRVKYRK